MPVDVQLTYPVTTDGARLTLMTGGARREYDGNISWPGRHHDEISVASAVV